MQPLDLDHVDKQILDLLTADARQTVRDLATAVNLSPSPVRRRIERMERRGVIQGYTTLIDQSELGETIEAFAELRFKGSTKVEEITASAKDIPEVIAIYTVAGDPDALVHFRVESVKHLHQLIDQIRSDSNVIGTKTVMVLDSWRRGERTVAPPG